MLELYINIVNYYGVNIRSTTIIIVDLFQKKLKM